MLLNSDTRRLLALFAELLDYPRPDYLDLVSRCAKLMKRWHPGAATLLAEFHTSVDHLEVGRPQETYAETFDFGASQHLYVGAHLLGESYKRSVFLLWLKDQYRAHGFDCGAELPDHLPVLLRFLSICENVALADELIEDGLQPMLQRLLNGAEKSSGDASEDECEAPATGGVYRPLLAALYLILNSSMSEKDVSIPSPSGRG